MFHHACLCTHSPTCKIHWMTLPLVSIVGHTIALTSPSCFSCLQQFHSTTNLGCFQLLQFSFWCNWHATKMRQKCLILCVSQNWQNFYVKEMVIGENVIVHICFWHQINLTLQSSMACHSNLHLFVSFLCTCCVPLGLLWAWDKRSPTAVLFMMENESFGHWCTLCPLLQIVWIVNAWHHCGNILFRKVEQICASKVTNKVAFPIWPPSSKPHWHGCCFLHDHNNANLRLRLEFWNSWKDSERGRLWLLTVCWHPTPTSMNQRISESWYLYESRFS